MRELLSPVQLKLILFTKSPKIKSFPKNQFLGFSALHYATLFPVLPHSHITCIPGKEKIQYIVGPYENPIKHPKNHEKFFPKFRKKSPEAPPLLHTFLWYFQKCENFIYVCRISVWCRRCEYEWEDVEGIFARRWLEFCIRKERNLFVTIWSESWNRVENM